jgi:outer membrane protein assembly factor BamB
MNYHKKHFGLCTALNSASKRRNAVFAVALILLLALSATLTILPFAVAEAVPDRNTGAYLSVNPHVIGTGQQMLVNLWIYPSPCGPNFEMGSPSPWHFNNITVTFTRPDGTKDTFAPLDGSASSLGLVAGQTEEIGAIWFMYTPAQLGNWSVSFSFPGETYTALNYSVYYKPSTSQPVTFTVQKDPVQVTQPVQLPTGYWTRPISAENREWYSISGDWLGAATYGPSGLQGMPGNIYGSYNPYSTAPNSAHILWKTQVSWGGLIGGGWGSISNNYYVDHPSGGTVFITPIIIGGRLYYSIPGTAGTSNGWPDATYGSTANMITYCRDLRTGEVYWTIPGKITNAVESTIPSALNANSGTSVPEIWGYNGTAWTRWNAWTGVQDLVIPITNASIGSPNWINNNIAYCLNQGAWNSTTMRRSFDRLIMWNASLYTGGDWNTGVQWVANLQQSDGTGPGEGSRGSSIQILPNLGMILVYTLGESKYYAFDLNSGKQLWVHDIGFPVMAILPMPETALIAYDTSSMTLHSWDIKTWTEKWSVQLGVYPWGSDMALFGSFAYNNLYIGAYDGRLYCIDTATGKVTWSFYTGDTTETPFGTWSVAARNVVADGKVYFTCGEHSPTQPRTRGNQMFCVDALTGKKIWNLTTAAAYASLAVADGYLINPTNEYDGFMYCFGKGQTATTVSAPQTAIAKGSSILVSGTVMDLSPAQPNTAAVSDDSMSEWMDYLHMQNATLLNSPPTPTGVTVTLTATAPDGTTINIGETTSDGYGKFYYTWTPPNTGLYKIQATFAGSESYWSSTDEAAVSVLATSASPSAPASPTSPPTSPAPTSASSPSPSASASASTSPSIAPPPSTQAAPSMTLYIAIAVAAIIVVAVAVAIVLKRQK